MSKEAWKSIIGYESIYSVSNHGRVKSIKRKVNSPKGGRTVRERILINSPDRKGYLRVSLSRFYKRKNMFVHRLVAIAFIKNHENKPQINHKNGTHDDNRVENLEWATPSENANHAFSTLNRKGSWSGKRYGDFCWSKPVNQVDMNGKLVCEWDSGSRASDTLGIDSRRISECCNGKIDSYCGYRWEFPVS